MSFHGLKITNWDDSFPLQEESIVRAMEYKNVKENLFGVSKYNRCNYNNFKDKDRYTIGKYATIYGNAAVLWKFKKLFPHYTLTESTFRAMRWKYYRIVKSPSSSSPMKNLPLLKKVRLLRLGSQDLNIAKFLRTAIFIEYLRLLSKVMFETCQNFTRKNKRGFTKLFWLVYWKLGPSS